MRLVEPLGEKPHFSLIDWLDAQPLFPKFYWQSRDTREEVVALGQLHSFVDPGSAYTILGEGQRVWGGRSFDGQHEKNRRCMSSFFFLPQIELIRFDEQVVPNATLEAIDASLKTRFVRVNGLNNFVGINVFGQGQLH